MRDWEKLLEENSIIWRYDGEAKTPHALLQSGLHSDVFFFADELVYHPLLLKQASESLCALIKKQEWDKPDVVVGAPFGGSYLAVFLAAELKVEYVPVKKLERIPGDSFDRFAPERFQPKKGSKVLFVDDVSTTGSTFIGLKRSFPHLQAIGAVSIICRGRHTADICMPFMALVYPEVFEYTPDKCPLCTSGSKALKPKLYRDKFVK